MPNVVEADHQADFVPEAEPKQRRHEKRQLRAQRVQKVAPRLPKVRRS
jgi:hypothetical protein